MAILATFMAAPINVVDCGMINASHERFAEGYLLTRRTMRWFYGHHLRESADVEDWRASPFRAAHLSGWRRPSC